MTMQEFEELKEDIKINGDLREPIITLNDRILDGRHRALAIEELVNFGELDRGIVDRCFERYDPKQDGENPAAFVVSRNLKRRHLNLSVGEKAALVSKILNSREIRKPGGQISARADIQQKSAKEQTAEVARIVGTSADSVEKFRAIEKKDPELAEQVAKGVKPLNTGKREAKHHIEPEMMDQSMARIKKVCGPDMFNALCSGAIKLKADEIVSYADKGAAGHEEVQTVAGRGLDAAPMHQCRSGRGDLRIQSAALGRRGIRIRWHARHSD
jgi:hypothetical protein